MLSVQQPIDGLSIYRITMLKRGSVWFLEGYGQDKLVIKTDSSTVTARQYKFTNFVVKAIAPEAKVTILSANEQMELRHFITAYHMMWAEDGGRSAQMFGRTPDIFALSDALDRRPIFVKMAFQEVIDLQGALVQGTNRDLRPFRQALIAPGGLEKLGMIIAADLFNGNSDRFFSKNKHGKTAFKGEIGGRPIETYCLANFGNVFAIINNAGNVDASFAPGALDFVDPWSGFKDIHLPLKEAEAIKSELWPGRILGDAGARREFARDCVNDLEKLLTLTWWPGKHVLGEDAAKRLEAGMVEAGRSIRQKLGSKRNFSQGVADRYEVLSGLF